jgi:hypothetical protein
VLTRGAQGDALVEALVAAALDAVLGAAVDAAPGAAVDAGVDTRAEPAARAPAPTSILTIVVCATFATGDSLT